MSKPVRNAFQRSYDKRRFMTSRFVRRGASYWEALRAANTLFPLDRSEMQS